MKLKNHISIAALAVLLGFASCGDQFEYNILTDPNEVTAENADVNLFFNAIQIELAAFFTNASNQTMPSVRMTAMTGGNTYDNAWGPTSFNFMWNTAYADIFSDVDALVERATENEQFTHVGAAQVMKGYVLMTLVDYFGDIPWSEALQGVAVPSPASDDDASVYDAAIALLDEAIANLQRTSIGTFGDNDFFYAGDPDAWIKAANTFKMKAYLNMGNTAAFDAIVNSGDFISSAADDFVFPYTTNRVNPNSRHPWYNEHYEVGNGRYHSNANMYNMRFRYGVPDPRIRYYYYRQDLIFGDESGEDQFALDCPGAPRPTHYPSDMPFCLATIDHENIVGNDVNDGYYGRDHGNNEGIPPDGELRTNWGVYPAGGLFDENQDDHVKNLGTDGGLGAGIAPIMMSSFVDFMRAERALAAGDAPGARALMEQGMRNSNDRVISISEGINNSGAAGSTFRPSQTDIDDFVDAVLALYDAGNDAEKMNVLQYQNHHALFGNGYEAYNAYRRTGAPTDLQFTRDQPDPGTFPRLMLYPADYVNLNASIDGNRVLSQQVFWDTLPAGTLD